MRRHRILHLRASNFVGGPEHQLLRYADSERGDDRFDLLLGTFIDRGEGSDFLQAIAARGLGSVSLPATSWGSALRALSKTIVRERIDLLCTHGYRSDVLGLVASRLLHIPCACFLRGWIAENYKVRLYEELDRFAIQFADRIVCLSPSQAKRLSARYHRGEKIRIVCNAIDTPSSDPTLRISSRRELNRRFNLPNNCLIVASAGRLSPEKGVGDFLEAISRIRNVCLDVRFLIFGDGVLRQSLERTACSLSVQNRVTFAGFHPDLRSLLPGLDLLVNPSHSEEMPNIVLEAMAAGVPVVATRVGGVQDIAGPECAVHLVPSNTPDDLAKAIGSLVSNDLLRQRLAEAGRARVKQAFSLAAQRSQFHSLYRELLPWPDSSCDQAQSPAAGKHGASESSRLVPATVDFLSIVVPVRNEESRIDSVLRDLQTQDYPHDRFEVLVVDGNSTDRTATIVEEIAKRAPMSVRLLGNPSQLASSGRNVGAKNAKGEFVIYIDGHCQIPSTTLLRDAVALFEKTKADCLCRPQPLTMAGNTVFQDVVAHARATPLGHARDSTIFNDDWEGPINPSSSGAMYRRGVFDRVGFFDERLDACEDVDFNYRVFKAGLHSFYSSKLRVTYEPRRNLRSFWKQMERYGQGRYRLLGKHPDAFSLSQIIPAAFLVWLAIGGVLSFSSGRIAAVFLASLAVYFGVVLLFSGGLAVKYGWRHVVIAPLVFACIHLGLGAGFLKELLRSRWRQLSASTGTSDAPTGVLRGADAPSSDTTSPNESPACAISGPDLRSGSGCLQSRHFKFGERL